MQAVKYDAVVINQNYFNGGAFYKKAYVITLKAPGFKLLNLQINTDIVKKIETII